MARPSETRRVESLTRFRQERLADDGIDQTVPHSLLRGELSAFCEPAQDLYFRSCRIVCEDLSQ